ncbi:MAG: nucleotide exchange factor GrpE [Parcubacteria group bacterium]|nr:nucleotide exchange factor GrpE [Parcubacteria group bacterium]
MDDQEKKQLEEKLSICETEKDEYLNGWKRAKADLINAKKEWEDQTRGLGDYVKIEFIKNFLPVLDALEAAQGANGWDEVKKLAKDVLKKSGVEEITALGQKFDPVYHEAVGESEGPPDEIVEVVQKGYKINGRVIRAAKVKVGKINSSENSE